MISCAQLVDDLQNLGIHPGDAVMMHSSLSALGPVDGGAQTVVDALLEVVGPEGTLLVPAFRDSVWGAPENFTNSDCCCGAKNRLCPSQQPGFQGIIPETIRQRPGSLRSCHPTHSWVALGPAAKNLLSGHAHCPTMCGKLNPFEPLVKYDGAVLTLGVGVDSVTLWHYYEEILQVPYAGHFWSCERHFNHCVGAKRIQYEFPGIMQDVCIAADILKTGKVGRGSSGVMRARVFDSFMATIFADDPWCMGLRPTNRNEGNLVQDALAKGAAMLRAWSRGPRCPQKIYDFPPAPIRPFVASGYVREDCPSFAGYHDAGGNFVPMCHANGRHPELFRLGSVFDTCGPTQCERCSWNAKYPLS